MSRPTSDPIHARQLWFTGVGKLDVRTQELTGPGPGELLIATRCSAISAGTELLVYRGQIPQEMTLDASLAALQRENTYPLQYGYASVGRVEQVGTGVDPAWLGKLVFAFQPHASHFLATPANVIPVPADLDAEDAVFLANMETAVNLVQDGNPGIGETVVVLGQGIVGLLLSALLARFPLERLLAVDALAPRRARALQLGVHETFAPDECAALRQGLSQVHGNSGADLVYEVSGTPSALNLAMDLSGFASRIVIGSWYGNKTAAIALGGEAHRNRLQIVTSQVSTLAPGLSGRWTKARRFDVVWDMLRLLRPRHLITHRATLDAATSLYQNLHEAPEGILQAVFVYD